MTAFQCPLHGEYTDDGYPAGYASVICLRCVHSRDELAYWQQGDFDLRFRTYENWRASGVPARGRNRTLENWKPVGQAQAAAAKVIAQYSSQVLRHCKQGVGLTLCGPPGVGKTHILCGLVTSVFRVDFSAQYIVWADVLDRHKATFGNRDSGDTELLAALKTVPFLCLDEIGVRPGSEFDQALLFDLIDTRYRAQRATVVATNLTTETLDSIGERTADRLREMNLSVVIPGDSQRVAAATNRVLREAEEGIARPEPLEIPFELCINGAMVSRPVRIASHE